MPAIMYTYQTNATFATDAPDIRSLNIDVVMNYYADNDYSSAWALAFMDICAANNLKALLRLGHYTQKVMSGADYIALDAYITALKDHPAVYGWYAYDEPTNTFPTPQLKTVYDSIKAIDSVHPIVIVYPGYGTGFWPPGTTAYPYETISHDIFGINTYPTSSAGAYANMPSFGYSGDLTGFTSALSDTYTNITSPDVNRLFFLLQVYVEGAGYSLPTPTTLSEMKTAAKNVGWTSKGIGFFVWTWYGRESVTSCLKTNTGLWSTVASIASQYEDPAIFGAGGGVGGGTDQEVKSAIQTSAGGAVGGGSAGNYTSIGSPKMLFYDRVKETATCSGTSNDYALAGAEFSFQAFSTVLTNGLNFYYCAVGRTSGSWETGIGTYSSSGNTVVRTLVSQSSNSNAAVNWTAETLDIFLSATALNFPANTSTAQKFLSETGDGTNGGVPSWQTIPTQSTLTYYLQDTASAVSTYKKLLSSPFSPKTLESYTPGNGTHVIQNYISEPGFPGLAFIPAGQFEFHIHAYRTGGTVHLYAEVWESDASGADIAIIGTTEQSVAITTSEVEYRLFFDTINTYTMGSTASRIVCRVWAITTGGAVVNLYVGGTADSHLTLPTNTIDATNFVPYSGATADVNLGAHNITANNLSGTNTGDQTFPTLKITAQQNNGGF